MTRVINKIMLIFIGLALILQQGVRAEEIMVVTEQWQPYNYLQGDKVVGQSTHLVRQVLANANIQIKQGIQLLPWARAYNQARNSPEVLIYTISRIPEREHDFYWIGPIAKPVKFYFYKLSSAKKVQILKPGDAQQYRISVLRGSIHETFLISHGFDPANFIVVSEQKSGLQLLLNQRADLLIDTADSIKIRTKEAGLAEGTFSATLKLMELDMYMAFGKKTSVQMVDRLRSSFAELQLKGEIPVFQDE